MKENLKDGIFKKMDNNAIKKVQELRRKMSMIKISGTVDEKDIVNFLHD